VDTKASQFGSLLGFLGRLLKRPSTYAVLYLAGVPVFALLYLNVSQQFFHSTIRFEAGLQGDRAHVTNELGSSVVRDYRANRKTTSLRTRASFPHLGAEGVWESDITFVRITDLEFSKADRLDKADVSFHLRLPVFSETAGHHVYSEEGILVSMPLTPTFGIGDAHGFFYFTPLQLKGNRDTPFPFETLFPQRYANGSPTDFPVILRVSRTTQQNLVGIWQAEKGFPSAISGNFWRLLYLSLVTITTLGYGDIVPIGPAARALVGTESIFGIVVIGAFLGTLYRPRSKDAAEHVPRPEAK
jgi:ion channel